MDRRSPDDEFDAAFMFDDLFHAHRGQGGRPEGEKEKEGASHTDV